MNNKRNMKVVDDVEQDLGLYDRPSSDDEEQDLSSSSETERDNVGGEPSPCHVDEDEQEEEYDEITRKMNRKLAKVEAYFKMKKQAKTPLKKRNREQQQLGLDDFESDHDVSPPKKAKQVNKKKKSDPAMGVKAIWSSKKISTLIDLLEERACLWNIFDKEYHLREKKLAAYKEMESNLGISMNEIKTKVLNLRSSLGRELAKVNKTKSGQGADELYKPNWVHWERLQFLRPVMQPGKSRDNFSESSSQEKESANSLDSDKSLSSSARTSKPTAVKRSYMEQKQELWTSCLKAFKEPDQTQAKPCHFSLFIGEKLSKMDNRTRTIAEKRIYDVIFDMEINGADASSVSASPHMQSPVYNGRQFNVQGNNGSFMSYLQS